MPKRINMYGYGDPGEFDKHNPFYLYRQEWAPEILFEIARANRYELSKYDIASKLDTSPVDLDDLLSNMENIGMVSKNQDKYSVSFMVILEKDLPIINNLTNSIALRLSQKIMRHKQEIQNLASSIKCLDEFGYNRILYHVIGCDILDGTAFFEFSKRGILSTSKPQYDQRDYILIGFEQNEVVSRSGDELLCSRNCKGAAGVDFASFGDCNGDRQDMFRFMRQVTSRLTDLTPNLNLNSSYIHSLEQHNEHLTLVCAEIVRKALCAEKSDSSFSVEEKDAIKFLEELGYIELDESGSVSLIVPLFDADDERVIENISDYLIELIGTEVASEFSNLKSKMQDLSAVLHGVDEKEIANGLWHQVLGNINEYLVRDGLFTTPESKIGEGRYFQAIYVKST
jgi:phage gp36-like protein